MPLPGARRPSTGGREDRNRGGAMKTRGLETLYPFLGDGPADDGRLLDDASRSTEAKLRETTELRQRLGREAVAPLIECAHAMAASFLAGGRLLAFGNGGSATDAQAVAQLFLHPPRGLALPALCLGNDVAVITALSND